MKKDWRMYTKLFSSTFSLSAFTLGGGYVIVPLMRKKFVDELHWLEEKEMLDLTAIAQSSPGALAVNASILIGYRIAGVLGAIITILGTVLPPLITISLISLCYDAFRESVIAEALMFGMQAAVAAVIVDVVISMGQNIFKEKNLIMTMIMFLVFILNYFLNVNLIVIILGCGAMGAMMTLHRERQKKEERS